MVVAKPASPNGHILIIDNNLDESRLLVETLRGNGYRLSIAFDGVQGYDRAVAGTPDLILLDVQMPKVDGFATCRRLKANPSLARIPVIFLGVSHGPSERLMALKTGGVDYVLRPYAPEEVLARVRIHLASAGGIPVLGQPEGPRNLNDDQVLVRAVQQYLVDNLANVPSLGCLARMLGSNEKRLSRAFQKYAEMTVFEYLRQQRMRTAQRLLKETGLTIVAISQEVGFSRAANFSTAFREYTGMSPSEFRTMAAMDIAVPFTDSRTPYLCYADPGRPPVFCGVVAHHFDL